MYFLFAARYFKAKKSTHAINIIAWISVLAIAIGTTALIMVLSVFNGFENLVKNMYSSFYPSLKISPVAGKTISLSPQQLSAIKQNVSIKNIALVAEEKAVLQNGEYQAVVHIKGVDEQYRHVANIEEHIITGQYDLGNAETPKIILGAGACDVLGVSPSKDLLGINVILPRKSGKASFNLLEDLSTHTIYTSAAFVIQQEFDNNYGITNIDFVKNALQLAPQEFSAAEIALVRPQEATKVKVAIEKILGIKHYKVETRYQQNKSLYAAMRLERWIIYGVLCLILIVAAFSMIGSLTMLVLEKQKDIKILNALGASKKYIRNIFLAEGAVIALIGGGIGVCLSLLLTFVQQKFHVLKLAGSSFMIDYFPVDLHLSDIALVIFTVSVITLLASWLPAAKAANSSYTLKAA